uniref:histidine kinase n=1 Tax=Solibacter usitatus (strain Ellin6076) TaxID=234267 RepID=Q01WP9_SOLUE
MEPPLDDLAFDDLTALAAGICEAPMAVLSFVDEDQEWFQSNVGVATGPIARNVSFGAHTILQPDLLIVPDAGEDARFAKNPLVTGDPHVRFYAGVPVLNEGGAAVGALSIMGRDPRQLSLAQQHGLRALSRQVTALMELRRHRLELTEGEAQLFRVLRGCPIALTVHRMSDGAFVDANDIFTSLTGWSCKEVIGHKAPELQLVDGATAARLRSQLEACGELHNAETTVRTRSGELRKVLLSTALVELRSGLHAITTFVDITERKRAEDELREHKRRLAAIIEHEPECVTVMDAEGRLLEMNPAGLAMLDVESLAEAQEKPLVDYVSPEYRAVFQRLQKKVLSGGSGTLEFELVGRRGTHRWLETHAAPLRDAAGHVEALLSVTVDMTRHKAAEEELREKHGQLQSALELARAGVWHWNSRTDRVRTIQGSGPVSGLPKSSYPSNRAAFLLLVHPDDRADIAGKLERARSTGEFAAEFRIVLPDGSTRWVAARGRAVRDSSGAAVGLAGVDRDITEQRRAERRIRQLNRVYSVLSDINETIVRESNRQRMLSEACRIAVESGEFRLAWIGLRSEPGGRIEVAAHAGATEDTVELLHLMSEEEPGHDECAFTAYAMETGRHGVCNDLARDERAAPWREMALQRGYRGMASLPLKSGGAVIGIFNLYAGEPDFFDADELRLLDELALDISFALEIYDRETKRGWAEQVLRESEERFRQLAENIQEVFWMTADQKILYVSPAYERIWGRPRSALYEDPRSWIEAVHPDDRGQILQAAKVIQKGGNYDETYRIQRPDGTVRWIHDHAFPVRDERGEIVRIVGTAEDITERRQLEEQYRQAQKMEAIGQLAGGVAHDFNNLLTVIHGYGSLLLAGKESTSGTSLAAQEIVLAAERAANLTRQLLAFGRRQVMQPRSLDLTEVVSSLTSMLQRVLGANIRLQLIPHGSPLITRADSGMLDQVLMNLVVNACDAMPDGGQLTIETTERTFTQREARRIPDARAGRYVSLRVTDTGSGISPESLPHIFEPFFTTKQPGKGTGLGLSTVFGIVKQHGGWVQVKSEVGRGTSFQIFLPAAEETDEARAAEIEKPEPQGGSETILVVEDEPALRVLTRAVLEPRGYRLLEAANGVEALRAWQEHRGSIHLLLTDIMMPEGMSGLELAARLREFRPELRVIYTSGYSGDIAGGQLQLEEGRNFLQKPYSPQQLLEAVRRCLDI